MVGPVACPAVMTDKGSIILTRVGSQSSGFLSVLSVTSSRCRINVDVQKFPKSLFSFHRKVRVFDKINFTWCWIKPRTADATSGYVLVFGARRLEWAWAVRQVLHSPHHRLSFFLSFPVFYLRLQSCFLLCQVSVEAVNCLATSKETRVLIQDILVSVMLTQIDSNRSVFGRHECHIFHSLKFRTVSRRSQTWWSGCLWPTTRTGQEINL